MTNLYTLPTAAKKLQRDDCMQYGHSWSDDRRVDGSVTMVFCSKGCGLSVNFPGRTWPPEVEPSLVTEDAQ